MWGRSFEIHQEPHLALRTMCFGATDLFPNTMLSSSRTVFSFTCSSFRLSAASESNYIHRRWAWLSWFNYPCLPSCVPTPPSLGLYPNAYSNLSAQASPDPKLNSWPTPSQESIEFCGQKAKEQRESTATLTPKTYLLASHGLKHFLQLDPQLLHVVHQDAGLWGQMELLSLGFF